MADSLESALSLLIIGMITVFVVLFLVVVVGNFLISLINKFSSDVSHSAEIDKRKLAVLAAVVESASEGKARIEKIEKL